MTANDHHSDSRPASGFTIVPSKARPQPFDPSRADRLMRQGLDFLLVREAARTGAPGALPAGDPGERDTALPTHTLELLIQELAAAMVPSVAALVGDAEQLMRKQQTLALACIYVCCRSVVPADGVARQQLGLLTDVVSDEHRFPWWRALPLQVALNSCGDGNGGFRTLYGNLNHPNALVRRHLLPIAWTTRRRLDAARLRDALGGGLAANDHWATALAVLRGAAGERDTFLSLLDDLREWHDSPAVRQQIACITGGDAALTGYVESPADLLGIERHVHAEVLRAATTRSGPRATG